MIKKYRKLPVEIEAIQFTYGEGSTVQEIMAFTDDKFTDVRLIESTGKAEAWIKTLEDGSDNSVKHIATEGDYIIKGVDGEFYPCKPGIFKKTYEEVK